MNAAQQLVGKFVTLILNPAIGVVFALATLLFVWGVIEFIKDLNEGKASEEGKRHMLWGVVGMLIMVSVFGIIAFISNTFGLGVGPNGTYNLDPSRINSIKTPTFGQ